MIYSLIASPARLARLSPRDEHVFIMRRVTWMVDMVIQKNRKEKNDHDMFNVTVQNVIK